jgi:ribosomal-protein-alanine N-acetyltransferase
MIKKWDWLKMSNIKILPLAENLIEDVYIISKLSFTIAWSKASIKKELDNKFAKYIVIKQNNIVVGFAGMWNIVGEAHITNIAVHPEYRGIGLGNTVIEALLDLCKKEKISAITLEVRKSNIPAQNLYKKFGFVEEGIRKAYYMDNKEDAIIMWKRL